MVAAAPHRGSALEVLRCGGTVLAVANPDHPELREASLAAEDGWAAAFVGRLDNAPEVAEWLRGRGHEPPDAEPPRLLISAFRLVGDRAPTLLRGAFAAVITDGRHLWCFRDHVGFETLFQRHDAKGVWVASEVKQVLAGSQIVPEPDLEILEQIFYDNIPDHTRCAYAGVRRILAGTILLADGNRSRWRRYWYPVTLLETASLSPEEISDRFDELMTQAVTRIMTGPDAVSLSGGIDSPALAAFASPQHQRLWGDPLSALSAVYPGFPEADEQTYIEEVVGFLGMPLHTYEPRPQRLTRLREWVQLFDSPWPTWSPAGAEQRLALARDLGFRTILDGNIAEQVMAMQRFLVAHLLSRGRAVAAFQYLRRDRSEEQASARRIARQLVSPLIPRWVMTAYLARNPLLALPPWLDARRANAARMEGALPGRQMWAASQMGGFGGSSLPMEASTVLSALYGVRERMPWGDVDLWEFFLSLPAEAKFPGPQMKGLVRSLLRGRVPDRILDRRDKTVMNQWFEATSMDYPSLRRWLVDAPFRVAGVDYRVLAEQIEGQNMPLEHYVWAKDLAGIHAFLDLW